MSRTPRSRPSVAWLQILLVGALACVVLILTEAARAARSSNMVAERALRDYADFAAWSYRQHVITRLREAIDELLNPVNHGEGLHISPGIPPASELGHHIPWDRSCQCHRPRRGPLPVRFLAFTLGADTMGVAANYSDEPIRGWLGDPPMQMEVGRDPRATRMIPAMTRAPREEHWINELLSNVARKARRSDWGYNFIVGRHDAPRYFASRLMPTSWGDTVVYALEYSAASIDSLLGAGLSAYDLLPKALVAGRNPGDLLDLEVSDAHGARLFGPARPVRWDLDATSQLPESYGGLRVRAQLRRELANSLLIGGVPGSRVPLLLLILALTAGLSVLAAVQLRREVRFANERANFVANVSHELRTPLTQVRLVLDTLRLGRGGDEQSRDHSLGVADREVLRLQHLVEGVLRFTRGRGRKDTPVVRADAAPEARAVANEFLPLATPRGVRIDVTGDATVPCTLQAGALRQVLLNLLDNAVKYGRDDSTVSVEITGLRGRGVRIAVTDSGAGVPPGERERIWRPFERGAVAKDRAAGGSGIGLTIVREIAQEHRGRAFVEDAPNGRGARFVVELPDLAQ